MQEKTSALLNQSVDYINKFEKEIDDIIDEIKKGIEGNRTDKLKDIKEKEKLHKIIMSNKKP